MNDHTFAEVLRKDIKYDQIKQLHTLLYNRNTDLTSTMGKGRFPPIEKNVGRKRGNKDQ